MSVAPVSSASAWSAPVSASTPAAGSTPASSSDSSQSAAQWFANYMSETPAQHMRDSILQKMGYTEADLKSMDPKKRQAIEDELTRRLKDQALNQTKGQKKNGVLVDIQA